jgi:acyl CoA:acetate/3-ketoacid CoA transferase
MLSFLEIDEQGNVNVHHLPGRRHVTPGYAAWSAGCLVVLGRPTRRRGSVNAGLGITLAPT